MATGRMGSGMLLEREAELDAVDEALVDARDARGRATLGASSDRA